MAAAAYTKELLEYVPDMSASQGRKKKRTLALSFMSQPHLVEDSNDGTAGENFQQLEHAQRSENVVVEFNGTTRKSRVSSWWLSLMTIFHPPAAGFQRIFYTCVGSLLLQSGYATYICFRAAVNSPTWMSGSCHQVGLKDSGEDFFKASQLHRLIHRHHMIVRLFNP